VINAPAHLDHLWRISDRLVVAVGWSADRSATAALQWLGPDGLVISRMLDGPRLHRPDVHRALAMVDDLPPAFGFLSAIPWTIEQTPPQELWISGHAFPWQERDCCAVELGELGRELVDACNWHHTPAEALPDLLAGDLGEVLLELVTQEQQAWQSTWMEAREELKAANPLSDHAIGLLLETSTDPALNQLQMVRLHRLLASRSVEAAEVQVLVLERDAQPLLHCANSVCSSLDQLLWMLPARTTMFRVPFWVSCQRVVSSFLEAWPRANYSLIKEDQLLPESGDGLQPGPSLPAARELVMDRTAVSWYGAVDAWLQQQCLAQQQCQAEA